MGTCEPVLAGRSGLEPDLEPLHLTQKSRPQSRSVESQPPSRRPQRQPLSRCVGRRARRGAAVKGVEYEDRQMSLSLCCVYHVLECVTCSASLWTAYATESSLSCSGQLSDRVTGPAALACQAYGSQRGSRKPRVRSGKAASARRKRFAFAVGFDVYCSRSASLPISNT